MTLNFLTQDERDSTDFDDFLLGAKPSQSQLLLACHWPCGLFVTILNLQGLFKVGL